MNANTPIAGGDIRAFVAIETSEGVKKELERIQADLDTAGPQVKWVKPGIIHLTIAFLGEIPVERVPVIAHALDGIASATGAFTYEVAGVGFFGDRRAPRVVWAGVRANPALDRLEKMVRSALKDLGSPVEDRPFNPHLTLGRVRFPRDAESLARRIATHSDANFGEVRTESVLLMKSVLTPGGPVYSILHRSECR